MKNENKDMEKLKKKIASALGVFAMLMAMFISISERIADEDYIIAVRDIDVRKRASSASDITGQIKNGGDIIIIAEEGEWYKVRYANGIGYILKSDAITDDEGNLIYLKNDGGDTGNGDTWIIDASNMTIEELNKLSGATGTYSAEENEKTDEEVGIEGIWIE